jgi:hypothetical protein
MKKLLLLMMIPNFVLAEGFGLVCEGELSIFRNDKLENTSKETQILQVKDNSIAIDSISYKSKIYNYGAVKGSSKYLKDDAQIVLETPQISNDMIFVNVNFIPKSFISVQ